MRSPSRVNDFARRRRRRGIALLVVVSIFFASGMIWGAVGAALWHHVGRLL